jgi:osmotically-inducible protein OsmY
MEAAKTLTPPIKAAISADKTLTGTKIDVSSGRNDVTISGHVSTQAQKDQARQDAQKVLTDMKASQKLINDLEVIPG